jgi:hypothetical protein
MRLEEKLESISSNDTVAELDEMLDRAHVSINWYGHRIVSVEGYEDSVEINTFALKYLRANAFQRDENPSLQERLDCYALWGRVQQLYTDSDNLLKKTLLFKYLTPMKEFKPYCRACAGDPRAILGEWEFSFKKDSLFAFTPKEFKKIWPDVEPLGESTLYRQDKISEKWMASKDMVEEVLFKEALY